MNKRADFTTIIILVAIILGLAIGSIIFYKVFYEITEELKDVEQFSNLTVDTIDTAQTQAPKLLDFFVFFVLISFFVGLIISSIYIDVNPAVVIVFIVAMVIAVVLAGQVVNVFNGFVTTGDLTTGGASVQDAFPLTSMILGNYFPLIILIIGMIVIVILYGKSRRQGLGGEV